MGKPSRYQGAPIPSVWEKELIMNAANLERNVVLPSFSNTYSDFL